MRKGLTFWIAVLFLIMGGFQSSGKIISDNSIPTILYVGGDGDGNYTNIQDAIDNASDGDTVFVHSGTYYENIAISKTIKLMGEDKITTIVDGSRHNDVVFISTYGVNISRFTIQNSGSSYSGISLTDYSYYNVISDNIISKNWDGVRLSYYTSKNIIRNNIISDNSNGISLGYFCKNNSVSRNTLSNNAYYGIYISASNDENFFNFNNLIKNGQNAHDGGNNNWDNEWNGNYWDDFEETHPQARKIWLKGIWSEPYEIPGGNNQDRYPLFKPYANSREQATFIRYMPYLHLQQTLEKFPILEQLCSLYDWHSKTFK